MALGLQRVVLRPLGSLSLLLVGLGCIVDDVQDGGDFDGGVSFSGPSTTTGVTANTTSFTVSGSDSATTSGTDDATSVTSGTSGTSSADSTTGPDEPFACGEDLTCQPGEICVLTCCGGPAPGCSPAVDGVCDGGTLDVDGVQCCQNDPDPVTCMMNQWCIPGPCVPDPIHCVPADMVTCNGSSCSTDGCYGELMPGGQLQCSCK